jgi:hypothetical protein
MTKMERGSWTAETVALLEAAATVAQGATNAALDAALGPPVAAAAPALALLSKRRPFVTFGGVSVVVVLWQSHALSG